MSVSTEKVLAALAAKQAEAEERAAKRREQAEKVFAALTEANPGKRFHVKGKS